MSEIVEEESCMRVLQQYKERDVRYALIQIRFRRTVRFLVYVEHHGESSMESVDMDMLRMRECFARLVKGRLSPCHLRDWIHDEMMSVCM